ncbi:MAG: hypothetical protein IK000_07745 [Bacteroidaceae bacterium]|nr:hypothetical protein [Bacteroidaceae bacterium]
MKKSFLSFLLGAVVIASASVFVSCQDYNDDINNLQKQIDLNKTDLTNQINDLKSQLATLQDQHDKDVIALQKAIDALEALTNERIATAKAEAIAEAQKLYADAIAHADAVAAQEAAKALAEAKSYAAQVAAAEALAAKEAAILAANEAAQKMVNDAINQFNNAIAALEAKHDQDVQNLKNADAAEEAARKAADAEIWVSLNKALADIEQAKKDIAKAQATADEALALAKANKAAIEAEVARAQAAEGKLQEGIDANAAEITKLWTKCDELNDAILKNAARIEEVYTELDKKIAAVRDRVATLENKVSVLEDQMKDVYSQLADHKARIEALEAWVAVYQPVIEDLVERMGKAESDIEDLYTKLAEEVARAKEVEADLQKQITENLEKLNQEIADRKAADEELQKQIDVNKEEILKLKMRVTTLEARADKLEKDLADEVDRAKAAEADLQEQIDDLAEAVDSLGGELVRVEGKLDAAIEKYDKKIAEIEGQLKHLFGNDFAVVTDVFLDAVLENPTYNFDYTAIVKDTIFPFEGAKGAVEVATDTIIVGEPEADPGLLVVTINPTTEDWTGKNLFLYDEKGLAHPFFTLANTQKYEGDYIFTRAEGGDPRYSADIVGGEVSDEELIAALDGPQYAVRAAIPVEQADVENEEEEEVVPLYAVAAEYFLYNEAGEEVRELCYSLFKFDGVYDINGTLVEDMDKEDIDWDVTLENEFDVVTEFEGFQNGKDSLHYVYCSAAIDACGDSIQEAADYMNGLGNYAKVINAADMETPWTVTVDEKYAFYTFVYKYYVMDVNGNIYEYDEKEVTIGSNIEPATKVFTFAVTPDSAGLNKSEAQAIPAELAWNEALPECSKLTATVTPVAIPEEEEGLQLGITAVKLYPEFREVTESEEFGKAEAEAVDELYVVYDPAKLVVGETYTYAVEVKMGTIVISKDTIHVVMMRPEGYDFDCLEKITSAWNKDKTRTIVWAQGFVPGDAENEETANQNAWYDLNGSFTNIPTAEESPKEDGTDFVFVNVTGEEPYKATTKYHDVLTVGQIVTMPTVENNDSIVVPYTAVLADDNESPSICNWYYTLEFGTRVFGLESLYGYEKPHTAVEHQFEIAFQSPIYHDGVVYNYVTGNYEGGCVLVGDSMIVATDGTEYPAFFIEFPRMTYYIAEANFQGSNDPSTSVYDPIKYFGEIAPDYGTWQDDRDSVYIAKVQDELTYRDARIYNVEIELAEAPATLVNLNDYTVWNDKTNEYLFEEKPTVTNMGIEFKTYDKYPSLQTIPAFYYVMKVTDIWGLEKKYPFIITINPNTKEGEQF